MKKLVIKPIGGLANRLLVVDSALKFQRLVKPDKTLIIWERNRNLNCSFKELFHYPDHLHFVETKGFNKFSIRSYFEFYNSFNPSNFRWSFFNRMLGKEKKFSRIYYSEDMERLITKGENVLPNSEEECIYISFYERFYNSFEHISTFKPIHEIQSQIEKVLRRFDKTTIGVHIRRSDHEDSIKFSPIEGFVKKMKLKINQTGASFFLTTDSYNDKKTIQKRFGERIIIHDSKLDRNTPDGSKDAVIDMFCLSNTREIIGSYNSTFSQVAAEIGRIENHLIYVDDKTKTI
ncbi:MAG: hypothetical protein KAI29_00070 [Cyclobacteriaceae bacterium]|nr:hypothetical protein [Cyclobacteriaceae bacterium]